MRIFLSGFESQDIDRWKDVDQDLKLRWTLMSYFHIRNVKQSKIKEIMDMSELLMIDSGAHSLQKGKEVDWEEYTHEYGEWISRNDSDKVVGYFEMDVDNMIGLDKVIELRGIMQQYTDKVIPVWHASRGNANFEEMCEEFSGKVVSFSGVADKLTPEEMLGMLQTAWKHGCKVHALGITAKKILNTVPFDYVDSSSWVQEPIYGRVGGRHIKRVSGKEVILARMSNFEFWSDKQQYYFDKWKGVSPMGD